MINLIYNIIYRKLIHGGYKMKYTIAICDDDKTQVKIVHNYILKINEETKDECNIIEASNAEELLSKISSKSIDIFLLDIEMPGLNGLELSKSIFETNPKSIIVFITGFKDHALEAFQVKAFDYILKPITYEKFRDLLYELRTRLKEIYIVSEEEKTFILVTKENTFRIKYKDICYFEKSLRKIKVVCINHSYEFYGSFKTLLKQLDMNYFTQCHQSFIVNNDFICGYKNQELLIDKLNTYIPVSKSYVKAVKECLGNKLF